MTDALKRLSDEGVAIWLDDLSRKRITSGNLAELIDQQHVVGVTTNPTIFQKAISGGDGYDLQVSDLAARKVTVYHGDTVLLQEVVAVGTDRTPTPLGEFFVDGLVPPPGTAPYGAGQVSVAGFSDVLQSFGGGVGQIALHGTNRPDLLGGNVSNGCVRMTNDAIQRMMMLAPLGTPVTVVA